MAVFSWFFSLNAIVERKEVHHKQSGIPQYPSSKSATCLAKYRSGSMERTGVCQRGCTTSTQKDCSDQREDESFAPLHYARQIHTATQ